MVVDDFAVFTQKIEPIIGLNLSKYKEKQLRRRILQFMKNHNSLTFEQFLKELKNDHKLLTVFKDFITINTSEFFRDQQVFEFINKHIMTDLKQKIPSAPVRIWSAGCSIGAEPYSLSILASEACFKNYQVLATDLDLKSLEKAKAGKYDLKVLKNVPVPLLNKYFTVEHEQYIIDSAVKQRIIFKEHNLLKDSYPANQDLILCRNVFIYFNMEVQHELIKRFVSSLKPKGFFIIGSSEFISNPELSGLKKLYFSVYQKI